MKDFNFHKTSMPILRIANYYLSCLDDCVFIDFNRTLNNRIYIKRVSFDGYGCCEPRKRTIALSKDDSAKFIEILSAETLNQNELTEIVLKAIKINKSVLWEDALVEYGLLSN